MNPTTQPNPSLQHNPQLHQPQHHHQPLFPPPLPPPPPLHQQQPPQLLQPHRPSTSCERHPQEQFTGFCPSCLCERLAVLDPNGTAASSSSSTAPRRVLEDPPNVVAPNIVAEERVTVTEIVEEEPEQLQPEPEIVVVPEEELLKPMKEHIDLDSNAKKSSGRDFKGSFWSAASVFSKKLQKWRQKQKLKKQRCRNGA
ncbi:hypothetical protein PIB30_063485, partial [Stylosanthes scabra]|nr:hypothetical protein [Stylosanthes scabra]